MSALPRRGGALPGDPTAPERAPRAAPPIAGTLLTDTATTNSAEKADGELAANVRTDRAGRNDAALAVASSNPNPTAGRLASAVPAGPRRTSRSRCSRSWFCW
ncbi:MULTISPECIES: hypothetical protein [unclassified Rhodococcus (in: high G+C Gram-positive bacteria)]|uniref:hypothetical protein n=1 Tax=unclassified Rhodococcus (in: high G+C Gram-positive bacteria) TaxID=192944 RepID=UPI0005D7A53F|nr:MULTISPECIES: hypothetical protein [unclassified Rhodococcus (in: high G+C Gram-positive bacteria)]AJW39719.1 hypothetical protein NY08_1689 [Rhodococcus sp. B7740]